MNTPRLITNQVGQAVWQWDNADPFGNNAPNENPSGLGVFTCNLRLPGQYFDQETNTHYNYFRDYDPGIGRYIQSDPIGLQGGVNTYVYAYDPLTQIDLLGLMGRAPGTSGKVAATSGPRFPGSVCGPAGDPRNFPANFGFGNFNRACQAHDDCYDKCGASKLWCDLKLQVGIVTSTQIGGLFGLNAQGLIGAAYTAAVIFGGQPAYDAAQKKACAGGSCLSTK